MMTFLEQAELADNTEFRRRVKQALIKSAVAVRSEAEDAANHAARVALARSVLHSPDYYGGLFAQTVVTNGAITAEAPDNDIEFTVNTIFDAFTGAA